MRVLFATPRSLICQPAPFLGEEQVSCGPGCATRRLGEFVISLKTAPGAYDCAAVAAQLSVSQKPDAIVVESDSTNQPYNLQVFDCPKVLLVSRRRGAGLALCDTLKYALAERFDRVVLVEGREDSEFFRSAGLKPFWIPALTLPHSDAIARQARCENRDARVIAAVELDVVQPWLTHLGTALVRSGVPLAMQVDGFQGLLPWYGRSAMGLVASKCGELLESNFEVLSGGALLLTERLPEVSGQGKLWCENEVVTYSTAEELVDKAQYLLNHPTEARQIALAGARWFDHQLNEQRRRDLFERVVTAGESIPEFALERPSRAISLGGVTSSSLAAGIDRLRAAYAGVAGLAVRTEGDLPELLAGGLKALPRVKLLENGADTIQVRTDVRVAASARVLTEPKFPRDCQAIWLYDITDAERTRVEQLARSAGYSSLHAESGWFERLAPLRTSEAAKARDALQQGRYEIAFEAAKSALKQHPHAIEAHLVLAELGLEMGNSDLFRKALAKCRQLGIDDCRIAELELRDLAGAPKFLPNRLLRTARAAFAAQNYTMAVGLGALAAGQNQAEGLCLMVQGNLLLGRNADAVSAISEGANRALNEPSSWLDVGLAALEAKHYADACAALLHAQALQGESDSIRFALAVAARALGLQPLAEHFFDRVDARLRIYARSELLLRMHPLPKITGSGPEARDLVICNGEITRLHGTGVLLQRLLRGQTDPITLRSQTLYGGTVELPGMHLVFRGPGLAFLQRTAQLERLLSPFRIRRILCVPFTKEDFENALAATQCTGAPLCTYVMDDQVAYGNVPAALAGQVFTRSRLRLVISPEMRDVYAQRFNLDFAVMPPLVSSTANRVENHWVANASSAQGVLVGNIWSETQFQRLRKLVKESGMKLDWYGNPRVRWLAGRTAELEKDGIFCRGFLTESELAARVARCAFVIVPSGTLDGTEQDEWLTRLSLPSRMVFILCQTFTPMLVLGSPQTCAARFVRRFRCGVSSTYDVASAVGAIRQLLDPAVHEELVGNARRAAVAFVREDAGQWLWQSLDDGTPRPAEFVDAFGSSDAISDAVEAEGRIAASVPG